MSTRYSSPEVDLPPYWGFFGLPFFGALPASSPVLVFMKLLFLSITSFFLILTDLLPFFESDACAVFGYGSGTPGGVGGAVGGVKHTSGNCAVALPDDALEAISLLLA